MTGHAAYGPQRGLRVQGRAAGLTALRVALLGSLVIGIALEFVQLEYTSNRQFEWSDVADNISGSLAGGLAVFVAHSLGIGGRTLQKLFIGGSLILIGMVTGYLCSLATGFFGPADFARLDRSPWAAVPWIDGMPTSGGLQLATASGFAPCSENVPVSIATCEANKKVTVTVRSSPRFLTMDQTQRFGAMLVEKLCSFELPDESMLPPRSATASADGAADEHASG